MLDKLIDEELNIEERETWSIDSDDKADWALEKLSDMQVEYERFAMVAKAKIQKYQEALQLETERLEREQSFFKAKLQEYFQTVDAKETKTQMTYKLPSGTLKVKKEQAVIEKDDAALLQLLKKEYPELVKVREVPDWAEFKKKLSIEGNSILNKETGEILEAEGLRVGFKPAEFDIKF